MQRAFDDATNRLAQRLEAESIAPPSPLRRPSRLMLTATPAPGRLEAAAADRNLDEARALCGTSWTNRLAALLPDGWSLGPCVGVGDGERLEPPCFDRIQSSKLVSLHKLLGSRFLLNFRLQNEDEGRVVLGEPGDPDGRGWQDFALRPGEHLSAMFCRYPPFRRDGMFTGLLFATTAGRSTPNFTTRRLRQDGPQRFIQAPPGLAIRNFYGRAKKHRIATGLYFEVCCLGVVFGPPIAAVWRPGTPVRFSDTATARAGAVLALADGEGPLGRLPEVLVHLVLAFAINLFPDYEVRGARRQLLDELETRPARSSDA